MRIELATIQDVPELQEKLNAESKIILETYGKKVDYVDFRHFATNSELPIYFPFLNSLGFIPFILLKKRAKVVTSAKWRRSEIWVMLSEVWRSRNTASIRSIWLM